jgi:hypothetical protein
MAVGVEYQGGLGGIGIGEAVEGLGNPMVISVVKYLVGCPRGHVGVVLEST